jgi:hypothetical protein
MTKRDEQLHDLPREQRRIAGCRVKLSPTNARSYSPVVSRAAQTSKGAGQ